MPADPKPSLTDAALDRLARGWFVEARARTRDEARAARRSRSAETSAGDIDGGLLDWLLGDDAADDAGSDGGD